MSLSAAVTRILTLSGFPPELKTRDIQTAFSQWETERGGFKIKWVDDTTLMLVFADASAAKRVYLATLVDPPAQLISSTGDYKKALIKPYDGPDAQAVIQNVNSRVNPRGHNARQSVSTTTANGNGNANANGSGVHRRGASHAGGSLGRTAGLDVAAANGIGIGSAAREPSPTLPSIPKMDTLNSLISSALTPTGEPNEAATLAGGAPKVGDPARRMIGHALNIPFKSGAGGAGGRRDGGITEVETSMGGLAITAE